VPSREQRRWQYFENAEKTRAIRKQIKRNRKSKRVRRKDWIPRGLDNLESLEDSMYSERVMPPGERERRQAVLDAAAASIEERQQVETDSPRDGGADERKGTVTEVSTGLCRVDLGGRSLICALRGSLTARDTGFTNVVAPGDNVVVSRSGSDQGVVEAVLPRRTALERADPFHSHLRQVIVANADRLLVVTSWRDPLIWFELVDRYLIAAERYGLSPFICVNKIDLADDEAECRTAMLPYLDLGYQVLFTSAVTGQGVDDLRESLLGHTTVLAGLSGVGKSSLLTAVQPTLELRTGEISETHREGRHITSQASLLQLDGGGFVVDTPGIREFGLSGLRKNELDAFYPEFSALKSCCRFGDCSHLHEPDCAVKDGVAQGLVSWRRYDSYGKIRKDLTD
jgi:ribosome biogenesis GTPase